MIKNTNKYYIYDKNFFITPLLKKKIKIYNNNNKSNNNNNNNNDYNFDFYNITIFKSTYERNNLMFIVQPQNYHFFVENGNLIYHPNNRHLDGLLKQYSCDNDFELAYNLPIKKDNDAVDDNNNKFPKVICHKKLKYLKLYIYPRITYYRAFYSLINPINGINLILNDII